MGKALINETTMTAIADAIRAKTGSVDMMLPSAMPTVIEGMELGGGSGSYVWTKQGMSETVTTDSTSLTYTLTTANDTRASSEIEYSTSEPTYNSSKRQWEFADSTVTTLVNTDNTVPSISGNVYCRVTSEPNVWYLVTAFNVGSSSPYIKSMAYSAKYTANVDSTAKKYLTDMDSEAYPNQEWLDGYWYEMVHADPIYTGGGGKTWTKSNITSGYFNCAAYADGIWVAGSSSGLYYSIDGKTWTQSNITSGYLYCVAYGNGIWVAGSNSGLYYSIDGKTWTQSNITSGGFKGVAYGNGIWVAGSSSSKGLYYSTDGKTWTQSNITSGSFYCVAYANGIWVAGSSGGIYYSTDGKTWTQSNITSGSFYDTAYGKNLWIAAAYNGGIYYSVDGKEWIVSNYTDGKWYDVEYDAEHQIWFAVDLGGTYGIVYSTDGKTWTQSKASGYCYGFIKYGNGIYITGTTSSGSHGLYYSEILLVEVDF